MLLTLANATIQDFTYSWTVLLPYYKIQSITVLSPTQRFNGKYNQDVEQSLTSGRTDSCPTIFSGDFNVYFFTYPPIFVLLTDIQDIQIELIECEPPPPPEPTHISPVIV